jgi:hypothetical protein
MNKSDLINKVDKYVENVENYWLLINDGTSKEANKVARANKKIINYWIEKGILVEILTPLLKHPSNCVKLAAAANLIKTELKDQAISVLEYLVKNDPGFISPSAAGVLRINKRS